VNGALRKKISISIHLKVQVIDFVRIVAHLAGQGDIFNVLIAEYGSLTVVRLYG
tara:strand:+ start:913 stop:1074 length:162 start_codon:yes stop_codon:yes gene_type:complete